MVGIFFVIAACFCWGLVFAIPKYLADFNPIEIALGRYLTFGFFSLILVLINKRYLFHRSYRIFWKRALWYTLICTFVSYTSLVACIKYANSAVAALIFGMSPVTIPLYGNWYKKEYSYRHFLIPGILMILGIILSNMNAFHFENTASIIFIFGLVCGFVGLAAWTWYAVNNFHAIKDFDKMTPNDWVMMMGITTLVLSLAFGALFIWLSPDWDRYKFPSREMTDYIVGSTLLGVVSSWFAFFLWNCGNKRLPVSLAGQLTIFEMIFGLILVYMVEGRWPFILEIAGIICMLVGVLAAFRTLKKVSPLQVLEKEN